MTNKVDPYDAMPSASGHAYGLHHVLLAIPVDGEDAAREFYVGVLGLTEVAKPAELAARGGLWVRSDRLEIHLGVEQNFRAQRKAHPGILVQDIDELARTATEHGYEPEWDDTFPGMRRLYIADNNGNRLEFLANKAEQVRR